MTNTIYVGNAVDILRQLPDESVDMCVTSPPYYGLRDYGCKGQIGLEETLEQYLNRLVVVFREVKRVLKDDGTLWVNIADSYAGSGKGRNADGTHSDKTPDKESCGQKSGKLLGAKTSNNIKPKDLIGVPWLLAFALRTDGWYLRQDIIWNKTNPMPESVKDRCTKSHEYIFLLSKSKHYYFDSESIKEPAVGFDNSPPAGSEGTLTPNSRRRKGNSKTSGADSSNLERESHRNRENTTGLRNKRDVWNVATSGGNTKGKTHFATFPECLITPCILAGSREGETVLDPFIGSGTTAKVANDHGRNCIGIELNPEYAETILDRCENTFFTHTTIIR